MVSSMEKVRIKGDITFSAKRQEIPSTLDLSIETHRRASACEQMNVRSSYESTGASYLCLCLSPCSPDGISGQGWRQRPYRA